MMYDNSYFINIDAALSNVNKWEINFNRNGVSIRRFKLITDGCFAKTMSGRMSDVSVKSISNRKPPKT